MKNKQQMTAQGKTVQRSGHITTTSIQTTVSC